MYATKTKTNGREIVMTTNKKSELWQRLRSARSFAEKTQGDIAKALKVSRPTVTLWESKDGSNRTNPSAQQVMAFARECGVPAEFMMDENADIDDVYSYAAPATTDFGALTGKPKADEAAARQARAFWSAVEFKVVSDRPSYAEHFEVLADAAHMRVRADFLHNRSIAEFAAPLGREDAEVLMDATAKLLVAERALGRQMTKYVLLFTKTGNFNIDGRQIFEKTFGVQVKAFSDIDKAAEFLLTI